jgi:hypothetical protein
MLAKLSAKSEDSFEAGGTTLRKMSANLPKI